VKIVFGVAAVLVTSANGNAFAYFGIKRVREHRLAPRVGSRFCP
jgi:hypothetical protein